MNKLTSTIGKCVAIAALQLLAVSLAHAQATRTWVSGVGDDVNPCSRTAPCKTWAGAISKTAAGGEISALDPGGFGPVTITKAMTLNGDGTLASILGSLTTGVIVNAGANDIVIIRNVSINGAGNGLNGIRFIAGGELHVENVSIYAFAGNGILFAPSGASALFVNGGSMRGNAGNGVLVQPTGVGSAVATLSNVMFQGNQTGLRAEDGSSVLVQGGIASGNQQNGFTVWSTTGAVDLSLEGAVASHNGAIGVQVSGAQGGVRISNVMASRNGTGIQADNGAAIVSAGNNRVRGNLYVNGVPTATPGQM